MATESVRRRGSLPPGIVPGLLRTRPVASGEFFVVHGKAPENASLQGQLIIAVPKRVLRRAVDRNAMRRVAREAWRAAGLDNAPIVAMLRMKRAPARSGLPAARGARATLSATARKRVAREELDRLFRALKQNCR